MTDTITVTGNIATEPEHKRTPAGVAITSFRVASGQRRYDRTTSTWIDAGTNWYTVSTFRGLADHAMVSLHKGDRVVLTGRLRLREWDTGAKKGITAEIDAEAIGHDLRWGTSRFERDAASAAGDAPRADSDWSDRVPEGWAVPGADDRVPVLVGAGDEADSSLAAAEAETPF